MSSAIRRDGGSIARRLIHAGIILQMLTTLCPGAAAFFSQQHARSTAFVRQLRAGGADVNETSVPSKQVLIMMDGFCSYHGGYLTACAAEIPDTAVIPVLSNYLCEYLKATDPDDADHWESLRVTNLAQRPEFESLHQAEVVAVYCESD